VGVGAGAAVPTTATRRKTGRQKRRFIRSLAERPASRSRRDRRMLPITTLTIRNGYGEASFVRAAWLGRRSCGYACAPSTRFGNWRKRLNYSRPTKDHDFISRIDAGDDVRGAGGVDPVDGRCGVSVGRCAEIPFCRSIGRWAIRQDRIAAPHLLAPLVGSCEILFGALVIVGCCTRLAAVPLLR